MGTEELVGKNEILSASLFDLTQVLQSYGSTYKVLIYTML